MDLTYTSPIKFDFFPITGSTVTFQFKLKASKNITKINIDVHIFYKDPYIVGRVFLTNAGPQTVYTSSQDQTFSLKFKIPEFNQRTQSYINVSLENPYFQEKVIIEDMKIESDIIIDSKVETDMTYAHPSAAISVPNLRPKTIPLSPPSKSVYDWYDKIMLVSTWGIQCGIATYTKYLLEEFEKIYPGIFMIRSIDSANNIGAKLVHLQHEFGIMPNVPNVGGKVIITWHTVPNWINETLKKFESMLDVVAHIVHSKEALEYLHTSKDIYIVNHGSMQFPEMTKDDARKILNIDIDKPIGFVFGFQSPNKNYNELINAAKNTNIHLMISGSRHISGYTSNLQNEENVTFLDKYLSEDEINLYSTASDILLFDYAKTDHYSVSGAMHRTIGAGRPVVCSDIKHFSDINVAWKFRNQTDLEHSILNALKKRAELEKSSLEYAKDTSWENIAKRHIEIYKKYIDIEEECS